MNTCQIQHNGGMAGVVTAAIKGDPKNFHSHLVTLTSTISVCLCTPKHLSFKEDFWYPIQNTGPRYEKIKKRKSLLCITLYGRVWRSTRVALIPNLNSPGAHIFHHFLDTFTLLRIYQFLVRGFINNRGHSLNTSVFGGEQYRINMSITLVI